MKFHVSVLAIVLLAGVAAGTLAAAPVHEANNRVVVTCMASDGNVYAAVSGKHLVTVMAQPCTYTSPNGVPVSTPFTAFYQ